MTKREFEYEKIDKEFENVIDTKPYDIQDISKEEFYTALSRCGVLKALDEDWENHSYYDWFVMFNIYAVKCLYAENEEELEKIRREFHEKSRRHRDYDYNKAEYMLKKAIEYQRKV